MNECHEAAEEIMRLSMRALSSIFTFGLFAWVCADSVHTRRDLVRIEGELKRERDGTVQSAASRPLAPLEDAIVQRLRNAVVPAVPSDARPPLGDTPAKAPVPKPDERSLPVERIQENVLTAFAKESADTAWSRDAARRLQSSIQHALPDGARLLSLDCRTTMCLVEIEYPDAGAAQSWPNSGFQSWPGAVFMAGEREESGAAVKTLVAIKEGTVPPYAGE
jgi:hypothetical protein